MHKYLYCIGVVFMQHTVLSVWIDDLSTTLEI